MDLVFISFGGQSLPGFKRAKRDGRVPSVASFEISGTEILYVASSDIATMRRQKRKGMNPSVHNIQLGVNSGKVNSNYCQRISAQPLCVHFPAPKNPYLTTPTPTPTTYNIGATLTFATNAVDGDLFNAKIGAGHQRLFVFKDEPTEANHIAINGEIDSTANNLLAALNAFKSETNSNTVISFEDLEFPTIVLSATTTDAPPFNQFGLNGIANGSAWNLPFTTV